MPESGSERTDPGNAGHPLPELRTTKRSVKPSPSPFWGIERGLREEQAIINHFALRGLLAAAISPLLWSLSPWWGLATAVFVAILLADGNGRKLLRMPMPLCWALSTAITLAVYPSVFMALISTAFCIGSILIPATSRYWGIA
jgi:hypothetical protein